MAKKVNQKLKAFIRCLVVTLICFFISLLIYQFKGFDYFEYKTYDLRMKLAAQKKTPCDDISFIIVDQESISWASSTYGWAWPWPREAYAKIVDFVSAGRAKSIAFDILFTEPSIYGDRDDQIFGKAEADSGIVIQTLYINENDDKSLEYALWPIDVISNNAAMLGNITSLMDDDDIIRRGRLEYEYEGQRYPTLGTAPIYLQGNNDFFDDKKIPKLSDGSVLLRYQNSVDDYFPYSAASILENYDAYQRGEILDFGPEEFEDQYVYVAYYGPGLFDICSTPVSNVFPGIGIHITTLDNYLTDSFMHKTPEILNLLWMFALSLVVGFIISFSSLINKHEFSIMFMIFGIFIAFSFTIIIPFVLFMNGIWIILVGPLFNVTLSLIVNIGISFAIEGKQRRFIKDGFEKCAPKAIIDKLYDEPDLLELGGDEKNVTAMITDLQKFSSFSEILSPAELDCFLLQYLSLMSSIIKDNMGIIDKYVGDEIVAIIGAPVPIEDDARKACKAAIAMKKAEKEWCEEIKKIALSLSPDDVLSISKNLTTTISKDKKKIEDFWIACKKITNKNVEIYTRIGINSGEMIVGFFGSDELRSYTMMGSNVNIAARLEGINKYFNTDGILISEATRDRLDDSFLVRKLDRVRVVNIDKPIRIYELLGEKEYSQKSEVEYLEKWSLAFQEYEKRNYDSALLKFEELETEKPNDRVVKYYIHLLSEYFIKGKYPTKSDSEDVIFDPETSVYTLKIK